MTLDKKESNPSQLLGVGLGLEFRSSSSRVQSSRKEKNADFPQKRARKKNHCSGGWEAREG